MEARPLLLGVGAAGVGWGGARERKSKKLTGLARAAGEREETRAIENAFKVKMKTLYEKRVKELEAMQHDFEQVSVLSPPSPRPSPRHVSSQHRTGSFAALT